MKYKKTPTDIEKETGRNFVDICRELLEQGLSPTEIAIKLELTSTSHVRSRLYTDDNKKDLEKLEDVLYPNLIGRKKSFGNNGEKAFLELTGVSLKEFLQQKYIEDGLSPRDISLLFGCSYRTIQEYFRKYGISKTLKDARQDAMRRGDIDYTKINASARKTLRKFAGSGTQEFVRDLFKSHFEQELINNNLQDIEIIVGYNEWSILKNMEIDIPIIVIKNNSFLKYAVEFNGQNWHTDNPRDSLKKQYLIEKNWKPYVIWYSNSNVDMEEDVKTIVKNIVSEVVNT